VIREASFGDMGPARRVQSRRGGDQVDTDSRMMNTRGMAIGLYAGSFDPPHFGHLLLIEDAARLCEKLFVVAVGNPNKPAGLFDLATRRRLLAASTEHLPSVVSLHHAGLVADLARDLHVDLLIRSMGKDQGIEFEMAVANFRLAAIPTVFLPPKIDAQWVSSRAIRAEFQAHGTLNVADLVPPAVLGALEQLDAAQYASATSAQSN